MDTGRSANCDWTKFESLGMVCLSKTESCRLVDVVPQVTLIVGLFFSFKALFWSVLALMR